MPVSQTLTEQVAQSLRQRIAEGHWAPGTTLPAERRLAAELGVSRGSLRAGIAQLQAEGLLQARQGSGTRVRDDLHDAPVDWLSWILSSGSLASIEVFEVIEQLVGLRRAVAMHVLEQAMERMTASDLMVLQAIIERQASYVDDPPAYRAAELEIERFFLGCAGNRVVAPLNQSLRRCFQSRPQLVEAFMGPLELHAQGNQLLLAGVSAAVAQPDQVPALLKALTDGLKAFEIQGLQRVRESLEEAWVG